MDYRSLRRYVNHDLLRNDILHHLCAPEAFFSAEDDETRERALTEALESVSGLSPKLLHYAVMTWTGRSGRNEPMDVLVMNLYERAKTLKHVRPTPEFPSEEQVRRWLDDISDYMARAETFSALTPEERHKCALKACCALRSLSDFLGALDVNSTHFWQLFAPDNR